MLAGVLVKAMGALFKIPLAAAAGDEAMGYFSSAYSVYSMLFLISTAGIPAALSRMIAAAREKNETGRCRRIFRVSAVLLSGIGLFFALSLYFFASPIAAIPKEPALAPCLRVLSPVLFFICVSAALRGYFQGMQNMVPTAVSQLIEAASNLVFGLGFGIRAKKAGLLPAQIAARVLVGIVIGSALSALFLCLTYAFSRKSACPLSGSRRAIAKELIAVAFPITLSAAVMSLCGIIDSMVAVRRLKESAVLDTATVRGLLLSLREAASPASADSFAVAIYGAYAAKAMTLFSLTPTLITPLATSLLPAVGAAKAAGDEKTFSRSVTAAFRAAMILAFPAAVGLSVLASPIIRLLFPSGEVLFFDGAGSAVTSLQAVPPMLSLLSFAIPFAGFVTVSAAVLQGTGHEKKSVICTLCGVTAKLIAVFFLPAIPQIGYLSLPLSTLICYLVMALMHFVFLRRMAKVFLPLGAVFFKPLLSAAFCGAAALGAYLLFSKFTPENAATVLAVLSGAAVYAAALFLTGAVRGKDGTPGDKKRRPAAFSE